MRTNRKIKIIGVMVMLICMCVGIGVAIADDTKYYIGEKVKTKKDAGYSGRETIDKDDPHYGWDLGRFYITGYSSKTEVDGKPVFLKTVGDQMTLHFELLQDIKKLNGDKDLSICEDTNGYDKYFGIEQTNFGRGALIIQHTDYQNNKKEPVLYTDYLSALVQGADVTVNLLEEGDYEITLDYEIRKEAIAVFGYTVYPTYGNYEIYFKFSVRNGNCMVYPFDVKTRGELTNSAFTENGFYLDFAKSHYLDIHIKREVYTDGADGGLSEDTRFNKPAKEGETFTDEGIYTITAYNEFTKQTTTKVIYVGTDNVMKAHVVTGYSFVQIQQMLDQGYTIADDGTFVDPKPTATPSPTPTVTPEEEEKSEEDAGNVKRSSKSDDDDEGGSIVGWIVGGLIIIAIVVAVIVIILRTRKIRKSADNPGFEYVITKPQSDAIVQETELTPTSALVEVEGEADETPYVFKAEFASLNDEKLFRYVGDAIYEELVASLDSDQYLVESVEFCYISKEYIQELEFNSQANIFFGYTLAELNDYFQGQKYVFTLGDDGQTTVKAFEKYDDTYEKALKNIVVGSGVILVCATVSVVSGGLGAPAVSMIFAASAKTGTVCALSMGAFGGIAAGAITGIKTKDMDEALKAAATAGSEGFKWGAIIGAVAGGSSEAIGLKQATKNGLTMNDAARIQQESKYPLDVIANFKSYEEYEVYKNAGLYAKMVDGKLALVQDIDLNYVSQYKGQPITNLELMQKGMAPIDPVTGKAFELHHVNQEIDGTLAILSQAEHRGSGTYSILHDLEKVGVHNAEAGDPLWDTKRKLFWKAFAGMF